MEEQEQEDPTPIPQEEPEPTVGAGFMKPREKPPVATTDYRPSKMLKEDEKLSQQEIEKEVLAIKQLRKKMLHNKENPYKEKLEKFKSMSQNKELTESIDKLLKEFEAPHITAGKSGEEWKHSEKTRGAPG